MCRSIFCHIFVSAGRVEPVYYNNVDKMMKGANDMVRKMRVAKRLTELVGNTPLMEMGGFSGKRGLAKAVIAKIE